MEKSEVAYIRFFNTIPKMHGIDVYVNRREIAKDLKYQEFSEYFAAMPGVYLVEAYESNNPENVVFKGDIYVKPNYIYTGAFIAAGNDGTYFEMYEDKENRQAPVGACIRFADTAQGGQRYDIYMDGKLVLADLSELEMSNYFCFGSGMHILDIKVSGTDETVIRHPALNLKYGKYYAAYITGVYEGSPALQVVIPLEGTTYL